MPRFAADTERYLEEKDVALQFFPYIGKIIGHPCNLRGSIKEIVDNGKEIVNIIKSICAGVAQSPELPDKAAAISGLASALDSTFGKFFTIQ
jgi:hypothetical protein